MKPIVQLEVAPAAVEVGDTDTLETDVGGLADAWLTARPVRAAARTDEQATSRKNAALRLPLRTLVRSPAPELMSRTLLPMVTFPCLSMKRETAVALRARILADAASAAPSKSLDTLDVPGKELVRRRERENQLMVRNWLRCY